MTVKCGGESEIDVELEEDGSLALSSLKVLCANATGLCFTSENGRRRSVRVVDNKCFPPQGKWGERVYEVVVPETDVNGPSPTSSSANICVSTTVAAGILTSGLTPLFIRSMRTGPWHWRARGHREIT